MPGLKLNFLRNTTQRRATGKSLPLKQVEAMVLYGRPAQRAKVVHKLLESVYNLALDKTSHHILLTLLDKCDNLTRVQMLYQVRRKILDLSTSPVGNVVLQRMLDRLPRRQRKEIAEAFVLNVDADELQRVCEHPFGNHVAQKLMEFAECAEVVTPGLAPLIAGLAQHEYGMRVVAKFIESVPDGWRVALERLMPNVSLDQMSPINVEEDGGNETIALPQSVSDAVDNHVAHLFAGPVDSMVLGALLRHPLVPQTVKDAIAAHACEYAVDYLHPPTTTITTATTTTTKTTTIAQQKAVGGGEADERFAAPDFGPVSQMARPASATHGPRHVHTYCALFELGDEAQRTALWGALTAPLPAGAASGDKAVDTTGATQADNLVPGLLQSKETVSITVAAVRYHAPSRPALYEALLSGPGKTTLTLDAVACDALRTLPLRAFLEVDSARVTEAQRRQLYTAAPTLACSPTGAPVLQRLVELDATGQAAREVYAALRPHLATLVRDGSGSFLVQALLQCSPVALRDELVTQLLHDAFTDLHESLSHAQDSRVLQKLLAYTSDEVIVQVVDRLAGPTVEAHAAVGIDEGKDAEGDARKAVGEVTVTADDEASEPPRLTARQRRELNRSRHYDIAERGLLSYALHNHACYALQALLRETRSRQLDRERRLLMNALKPHVFELAVSPWAGRVVLDAMLQTGSTKLAEAMQNVAFLRAEEWLMERPGQPDGAQKGRGRGKADAPLRALYKRPREGGVPDKAASRRRTTTKP